MKINEKLKYVTLLFQINNNRVGYLKAVINYILTKHPKSITFPEMTVKLHNARLITRKNTQDSAFLSIFYERELTKYLLSKKPKIFIDVGAHIGRFSILLAKNGSDVISVEPSSSNFKQLNKNILLNKLNNIRTLNAGCSDKEEIGELTIAGAYTGQNTFLKSHNGNVEKVELKKLDNILKNKEISGGIIKMDVEGFEINVLRGMANILKKKNPLIIAEISCEKDEREIKSFLKKFNYYNIKILDGRNFVFEKKAD